MAFSQRITGKNAKVLFIHSGGTVDLSGERRNLDITREVKTVNMEAGNDTAEAVKATLYHYAAELTMLSAGTAGTATMNKVIEGTEGTILWGADGTASGKPKGGFPALVVSQNESIPYPDAVEYSVSFEGQGSLAFDPTTATW